MTILANRSRQNWIFLVVLILIVIITGTILGQILRPYFPFLAIGAPAEMTPQTFRLADVFSLTFGFKIYLNLATIIGVILAFVLNRYFTK